MGRPVRKLSILVAILVGCLAAGCGSSAKSAVSNLTSRAATAVTVATDTPAATNTITPTPITPTPTPPPTSPTATVSTTMTVTATATATPTPTRTLTPATTAPTSPSSSPAAGGAGASLLWLWIVLGALILIGLIAWIVSASRRRSAVAADRRSTIIDAYAKGSALHDAMSVAESAGVMTGPDAGARWADIQRRSDDLAQTLYRLRDTVPDAGDRDRIADTLVSLQAVRSAMDAERAPGGAGPEQAQVVRSRLYAFESSLHALRVGDQGYA